MCSLAFLCRAPSLRRLWFGENRLCLLQRTSKRALLRNGGGGWRESPGRACWLHTHHAPLPFGQQQTGKRIVQWQRTALRSGLTTVWKGRQVFWLFISVKRRTPAVGNRDESRTCGIRLTWGEVFFFYTSCFTLKTRLTHEHTFMNVSERNLTSTVPEMHFFVPCSMLPTLNCSPKL